jgi:hypothetical protein
MKMLSLLITLLFSVALFAQENVPAAVIQAFNQQYPNAESVEWDSEKDGYEADFKIAGQEMEASFDLNGAWLETESDIDKDMLPDAVKRAVSTQFFGQKIEDVEQLSTPQWNAAYKIKLEDGDDKVKVYFDMDGRLLKRE